MRTNPVTVYFVVTGLGTGSYSASSTVDGVAAGTPTWQPESNGASVSGSVQVTLGQGTHTVAITFCESGRAPACDTDSTPVTFAAPAAAASRAAPIATEEPGSQHRRSFAGCAGCAYTTLSYSTPSYRSLDQDRAVGFLYSSALSAPRGLVSLDVNPNSSTPPEKISLSLLNPGGAQVSLTSGGTEVFYRAGAGVTRVAAQFDAVGLRSGAYTYTAIVRNWWPDGGMLESRVPVRVFIANGSASGYGRGWSVAGLPSLYLPNGENGDAMFLMNGQAVAFKTCGQGCWTRPPGEGSTFFWGSPGRLRRHYVDGTDEEFDSGTLLLALVRDRLGATTTFAYDVHGRLQQVVDPGGHATTITWTGAPGAAAVGDIRTPDSRLTRLETNGAGELAHVTDPDNVRALTVAYTAGRITAATNRIGGTATYAYDAHGALASATGPAVQTEDRGFASSTTRYGSRELALLPAPGTGTSANPAAGVLPDGVWMHMTSQRGDKLKRLTNGVGQVLKAVTIDALGKADSTIIGYDFNQQPKTLWTTSGARMEFGWSGDLLKQIVDNVANVTTDYDYNDFGQLTHRRVNQVLQERNTYSADSRSLLDSTRVGTSLVRYTYDALGRVLTTTDGGQHQTTFAYHPGGFGNLASVTRDGKTTQLAYDGYGRPWRVTDPANRTQTTNYDWVNRVTSVIAPDQTTSTWGYDDVGRQYTFTDAKSQQYTTITNALGATIAEHNPFNPSLSDQYRYDSDGNPSSFTTRAQRSGQIERDTLGRPIRIKAGGATVTTIAYDTARKWTAYSNAESTDTLFVDGDGRVTKQTTFRTGGPSMNPGVMRFTMLTTYGAQGQRRGVTISSPLWNGVDIRSEADVDTLGRPNYVGAFDGSWTSIAYNPDGQPQTISFPQANATTPRRRQSLTYTGSDRLASSTSNVAPDALSWSYGHDQLDRMSHLTQGEGIYAAVRTAEYDAAGRLGHWTDYRTVELPPQWICDDPTSTELTNCYLYTGTESQAVRDSIYTYDAVGNRTDLPATVQAGNRLTYFNGYAMQYDEDGNLASKTGNGLTQSFEWNAFGQLMSVTTNGSTTTFGYDGLGRRVRKTVNGVMTRYLHDGDNLVVQTDREGTRQLEFSYYPGIDHPHSVRQSATGNLYYYATSQPGHVTALVNRYDQVVNRYEYAPFGAAISTTEQVVQPFRFAGRELDTETGLYYNRARYYDPAMGRFISEDPIGLAGGVNLFTYAGNDPVNGSDPTGLNPCLESALAEGWVSYQADDGKWWCGYAGGATLPTVVTTAPRTPSGPPITTLPALPSGPAGPGAGSGGGAPPGRTPPAPPRPGPRLRNVPPSCASVVFPGNSGTIHIQVNPRSGFLQWGVVMHNPTSRGGAWSYQEYVGGRPVSGDPFKARDILHGSVNPTNAPSGEVFQLQVGYIDPRGFTHHSVPNACYIP